MYKYGGCDLFCCWSHLHSGPSYNINASLSLEYPCFPSDQSVLAILTPSFILPTSPQEIPDFQCCQALVKQAVTIFSVVELSYCLQATSVVSADVFAPSLVYKY